MNITSICAFSEIENRFLKAPELFVPPDKANIPSGRLQSSTRAATSAAGNVLPQFFIRYYKILITLLAAASGGAGQSGSSKMLLLYKIIKYTLRVPRVELQRIEELRGGNM